MSIEEKFVAALYPAQEPLSPVGAAYHERVIALGRGIAGQAFSYGTDPYQSLTVFPAPQPSGNVLVFFHGGGWTNGYKEWMYFMAPALQALGVTFVSASYRLAPQHIFPVGFSDAADALSWVAYNVEEYGGHPNRIFVGGHSAGGHYASLLAVTSEWRRERGMPPGIVRGCLPVSGVYRFGADSGLAQRPRFLNAPEAESLEVEASPLFSMEASICPPFLMTVGERDFPHLIAQAQQMGTALREAGVAVQSHVLHDCDHFEASVACGETKSGWPSVAAAWMRNVSAAASTNKEETA